MSLGVATPLAPGMGLGQDGATSSPHLELPGLHTDGVLTSAQELVLRRDPPCKARGGSGWRGARRWPGRLCPLPTLSWVS